MTNETPTDPIELDVLQQIAELEQRPTRNADLPPPFKRDFLNQNFLCLPDNNPPLAENIRGKLRALNHLVQEMIVPLRHELKQKRMKDDLSHILGEKLHNLQIDYLQNRIQILEEYSENIIDTMVDFEDYMVQNPEFILDLSKFDIPHAPRTGFENDLDVINETGDDNLQSVVLTILEKIQKLEKNLDVRIERNVFDKELQVQKGQLMSARLILESVL
jgi:hypothetical protein